MPTQTTSLTEVVRKAKEMQVAQRSLRYENGEDPGDSGSGLPDWIKLSWYREAAAELGVEL